MKFKIQIKDFGEKRFFNLLRVSNNNIISWLLTEFNCILTDNKLIKDWKYEYLIFPSKEDYFLFLLKISE